MRRRRLTDDDYAELERLQAEGHSMAEIARRMGIGWTTVKYALRAEVIAGRKARRRDMPMIPGLLPIYDKDGVIDFVRVDLEDWERFKTRRLFRLGSAGYAGIKLHRKSQYLHRVLLGIEDREVQCDHLNRDVLDNRRANLRVATPSENRLNRGGQYERCWWRQLAA
jgi:hypothetical protein